MHLSGFSNMVSTNIIRFVETEICLLKPSCWISILPKPYGISTTKFHGSGQFLGDLGVCGPNSPTEIGSFNPWFQIGSGSAPWAPRALAPVPPKSHRQPRGGGRRERERGLAGRRRAGAGRRHPASRRGDLRDLIVKLALLL